MKWCLARELTHSDELIQVAELSYLSSIPFYRLFSAERDTLIRAIVPQFTLEQSELFDTWVLKEGNSILGSYSAFSTQELNERQTVSLKNLLEAFPLSTELLGNLRKHRDNVAPIPTTGFYLARITTENSRQSKGIGSQLLKHFESSAGKRSPLVLHVERENMSAIRFYTKRGYKLLESTDSYLISAYSRQL